MIYLLHSCYGVGHYHYGVAVHDQVKTRTTHVVSIKDSHVSFLRDFEHDDCLSKTCHASRTRGSIYCIRQVELEVTVWLSRRPTVCFSNISFF